MCLKSRSKCRMPLKTFQSPRLASHMLLRLTRSQLSCRLLAKSPLPYSLTLSASLKLRPIQHQPSCGMKIYTRTGDKGTSALFTGERRPKTDPIFDALGCLDELSANLGVAIADWRIVGDDAVDEKSRQQLADRLTRVQCLLQECMSCVATPRGSAAARQFHIERSGFPDERATELEAWIDEYTALLPPLKQFILPSGSPVACRLHVARAICRRAERSLAVLLDSGAISGASDNASGYLEPAVYAYINRLSDFLFTVARLASQLDGVAETKHRPVR